MSLPPRGPPGAQQQGPYQGQQQPPRSNSGYASPYGGAPQPHGRPPGAGSPYPPAPNFPSTPSFQSYTTYDAPDPIGDSETAPLSANAVYSEGEKEPQFYPPQSNPIPGFMRQDPYGGQRRPQLLARQHSEAQSEADWSRRAGAVKRGVTRRVKLTKGNFIAVGLLALFLRFWHVSSGANCFRAPELRGPACHREFHRSVLQGGKCSSWPSRRVYPPSVSLLESSARGTILISSRHSYTAATCDPSFFTPAAGWSLRQTLWGRETELLVR